MRDTQNKLDLGLSAALDRRSFLATALAAGLSWQRVARAVAAADSARLPAVDPDTVAREAWDYVIIGAGAAGCVLAHRLSEDPAARILLLEGGASTLESPQVSAPPAWPGLQGGSFDWQYRTVSQPGLGGRALPYPRGKGLGGSTAINALGYMRGAARAYDRWHEASGDPAWSFQGLLPFLKRSENFAGGAGEFRGGDGPLHVYPVHLAPANNSFSVAYHAAVAERLGSTDDFNGARTEGAAWAQLTLSAGRRDSAARAYLAPILNRPNLRILTGARVLKLEIVPPRCDRIVFQVGDRVFRTSAQRETLLCAGSIDSPRLLMLSGIGRAGELERIGVAVKINLPGVGQNLQDHLLVAGVALETRRAVPLSKFNHCESLAITSAGGTSGCGEILLMGLTVPFVLPALVQLPEHAVSIVPAFLHPASRGTVSLISPDPYAMPEIDPAFLREAGDLRNLVHALELAREVAHSAELRDWVTREVYPGPGHGSRTSLGPIARAAASSFYHPVGTCKFGADEDPNAVVDTMLRVRGVPRLRVVDASVFPTIPQGMTEAATLAVAERAAALIHSAN